MDPASLGQDVEGANRGEGNLGDRLGAWARRGLNEIKRSLGLTSMNEAVRSPEFAGALARMGIDVAQLDARNPAHGALVAELANQLGRPGTTDAFSAVLGGGPVGVLGTMARGVIADQRTSQALQNLGLSPERAGALLDASRPAAPASQPGEGAGTLPSITADAADAPESAQERPRGDFVATSIFGATEDEQAADAPAGGGKWRGVRVGTDEAGEPIYRRAHVDEGTGFFSHDDPGLQGQIEALRDGGSLVYAQEGNLVRVTRVAGGTHQQAFDLTQGTGDFRVPGHTGQVVGETPASDTPGPAAEFEALDVDATPESIVGRPGRYERPAPREYAKSVFGGDTAPTSATGQQERLERRRRLNR